MRVGTGGLALGDNVTPGINYINQGLKKDSCVRAKTKTYGG